MVLAEEVPCAARAHSVREKSYMHPIQGGDPMQSLRPSRARLVCTLLTVLMLATVTATAKSGREFSGYFDVSGVQEQGELVQVTLHLKLFNHSDADAKSVI